MALHSLIRIARWVKSRHGHGVHSPFVYSFINDVIEESNLFYGYKDIADKIKLRRTNNLISPNNYLKENLLFFRISHFYQVDKAIAVGCHSATLPLYLQGGRSKTKSILIETSPDKAMEAISLCDEEKEIKILECFERDLTTEFKRQANQTQQPQLVYINHSISKTIKQNILNECFNFQNKQTLIIIDQIAETDEDKSFWQNVIKHNQVNVSIDLVDIGILLLNSKLKKQHYKLFF